MPGNFLAIDPGSARPGPACAYFARSVLVSVEFSYHPGGAGLDAIVWEKPQVDHRTRHIDPRTIVELTAAGALAAGHALGQAPVGCALHALTPTEWKGSEPKPTHHKRLWSVLSPRERLVLGGDETLAAIDRAIDVGALSRWSKAGADCYPRAFKTHNLLDAAALGCTFLGRLVRHG